MILIVDNFDSFTYNLVDYFEQLNQEVYVVRNNVNPEEINWETISHILLSPGPETPEKANFLLDYLKIASDKKLPCLGVCLGHQAINLFFGGTLKKGKRPMHGKVSQISHNGDQIFSDIDKYFNVVRYHSLEIDKLGEDLKILSIAETNEIMAIKHLKLPIYGVQFHPESILTDFGLKILSNWLKISV